MEEALGLSFDRLLMMMMMLMMMNHISVKTVKIPRPFNSKSVGQAILQKLTRKDIFVKQADMKNEPNSSKEINTQTQHSKQDLLLTQ